MRGHVSFERDGISHVSCGVTCRLNVVTWSAWRRGRRGDVVGVATWSGRLHDGGSTPLGVSVLLSFTGTVTKTAKNSRHNRNGRYNRSRYNRSRYNRSRYNRSRYNRSRYNRSLRQTSC